MRSLVEYVNLERKRTQGVRGMAMRSGLLRPSGVRRGGVDMTQRARMVVLVGLALVGSASAASALQPCLNNCAMVSVSDATGSPGGMVTLNARFQQGPDDGVAGEGNDDVAAVAFTIGIPGEGGDTPLQVLDCADSDGDRLPDAFTVGAAIRDNFRVVVENVECVDGECGCAVGRGRCLCPGDGDSRDNFINVAVFGPKSLPEQGPVDIPILPDSANLLSVRLGVASGTPEGDIPVRVFGDIDGSAAKPQFGAFLSVGDQAAIDQTGTSGNVSQVQFIDGTVDVFEIGQQCVGDCDATGVVEVSELVLGINIALDNAALSQCRAFETMPPDGAVAIDELVTAVNNALTGCPQ